MYKSQTHFFLLFVIGLIIFFNLLYHYTEQEGLEDKLKNVGNYTSSIDSNDLSFLKDKLYNKRIVLLGEQTHFDGTTLQVKKQIIKYLHKYLGYNVVLYEAGLYDFWWNNSDCRDLWEYYQQYQKSDSPLFLGGFDIQLTRQISDSTRTEEIEKHLVSKGIHSDEYLYYSLIRNKISKYFGDYFANQLTNEDKIGILYESIWKDKEVGDVNRMKRIIK
ncbi:MAG: hypothetical protein LBL58_10775 [Tannerellaceae bacterium]|jgi:hypothetical protein|nr:hypothetical protein [Tannerellaceae bacterium]